MLTVALADIYLKIDAIDPVAYATSRNYLNGAVTRLSPYISRGVISTRTVYDHLISKGWTVATAEKLIQELAWRDYWQAIWEEKGSGIDLDMNGSQFPVATHGVPVALMQSNTGIDAIDSGVRELVETGYIHNHLRMYIASLSCNIASCHWLQSAKWMYYHLLDGDWASNALSWQWVAGTFSNKKYFANQDNINRYCNTNQLNTFLDVGYDELPLKDIPFVFQETQGAYLKCLLPERSPIHLQQGLPVLIYTSYNLDPNWQKDIHANRILLLEPSHFNKYPVSKKVVEFILSLANEIPGIQVFVGEFSELQNLSSDDFHFKKHPFSAHFIGKQELPERLTDVNGFYPNFFKFWKKVRKELENGN